MSSDSERLPRPKKKPRLVFSESESDDSLVVPNRRKKRVGRVVSDEDNTDDDSDIPQQPVRKRKNHKLDYDDDDDSSSYTSSSSLEGARANFDAGNTSSEWESDWESMGESRSEGATSSCKHTCKKSPRKSLVKKQTQNSESESSDAESEKCPICLLSFRKQEVANPATCEHCFCLECLMEWSKNVNTCPIDRKSFEIINVRANIGGKILRYVPVELKSQTDDSIQEDPTYCEVCQQCDREHRMLLCDGCDSGFHLECLDPPMEDVPLEEHWYCPECALNAQNDAEDVEIDMDELPDIIEEARSLGLAYGRSRAYLATRGLDTSTASTERSSGIASNRRSLGIHNIVMPRTRQTERVRERVRNRRAAAAAALEAIRADDEQRQQSVMRQRRRQQQLQQSQPSTSSGFDSISDNSVPGPSSSSRITRNNNASSSRQTATASTSSAARQTRKKVKKKRKTKTRSTKRCSRRQVEDQFREVRISEVNEHGELEEIVTYVRSIASTSGVLPAGRRRKKRKKNRRARRRVRTVASVAAEQRTAKRRLAARLLQNPSAASLELPLAAPKSEFTGGQPTVGGARELRAARYRAGISQVSLFGNNLGLDYSPPG